MFIKRVLFLFVIHEKTCGLKTPLPKLHITVTVSSVMDIPHTNHNESCLLVSSDWLKLFLDQKMVNSSISNKTGHSYLYFSSLFGRSKTKPYMRKIRTRQGHLLDARRTILAQLFFQEQNIFVGQDKKLKIYHLFDLEFHETSQSFSSFRQYSDYIFLLGLKIVRMS